ncbi:MAG: DUF2848 family protein [Actinomycetota bacterium]
MHHLRLNLGDLDGSRAAIDVPVRQLLLAGYTGRDRAAVLDHVRELEKVGVAPPSRIPSVFVVEPDLVRVVDTIEVRGSETSGEVEVVLLQTHTGLLVGVGSDHTDRAHEAIDVDEAKGMCAKPISRTVWRHRDVEGHWDQLELRSWTSDGSVRRLYQEGSLAEFLLVDTLLDELSAAGHPDLTETVVFGGTLPTLDGLSCGARFEIELRDPVLGRALSCAYGVSNTADLSRLADGA